MSIEPNYNPFQSPTAAPAPAIPQQWGIFPFESGHQRAVNAIVFLAVTALILIGGAFCSAIQYASLQGHPDGSFTLAGTGAEIAKVQAVVNWIAFVVWIGTVITFCLWTHRAARNLPALGARGLKYTPGWSVGWFFIPLAHLIMPYFVASEIWRESDPEQARSGAQEHLAAGGAWWTSYIVHATAPALAGFAIGIIAVVGVAANHGNPQQIAAAVTHYLPTMFLLGLAGQTLGLIAAVLAIMYVRAVDQNQETKFMQHGEGFAA